ncbi:tricyclene synthase 0e23, chloroplastic-like isoform X2 [Andrographis paniculata]|nr:tricyclene synthase 0e23, chloroplastic-like isoform X2 [Andrographis paniculata]
MRVEELRQYLEGSHGQKHSLVMVDAIHRLGLTNQYRSQINAAILNHHYSFQTKSQSQSPLLHCNGIPSLANVSLSFRLLRCHGYHITADVFNDLKGRGGWSDVDRRRPDIDIAGLMELYEAAQLSFEGETILDEAEEFSSKILHQYCLSNPHTDSILSNNIYVRLKHPYHKSLTQITQRDIVLIKDRGASEKPYRWEHALRSVVEMDLHMKQSLFEDELVHAHKWWNGLGLSKELKLARNQPKKWYIWSMAMLMGNIGLSEERILLTKSIAFIYILDDVFDLYGTPHELAAFTQAIEKWDYDAAGTLPDYMKMCYKALLDTTNDIARAIYIKHGHNPIDYLKKMWANLCKAFYIEAKWFTSGKVPSAREYLENGKVSSGVYVLLANLYFLLGLHGTETRVDCGMSTVISSVATILRLWDDLGNAKDEHQDGKDGSYIACYMEDNRHVSLAQAREHVKKMIAIEWKRLNKECLCSYNNLSTTRALFHEASLNLARMVPLMYNYNDSQQLPDLEEFIQNLFSSKIS